MNIAIITNEAKDIDRRVSRSAALLLRDAGANVLEIANTEAIPSGINFAITFGGDGTLLHAARQTAYSQTPILGVNVGTLGYLAELEPGEISMLTQLLDGNYHIEKRMLLSLKLIRDGQTILEDICLNDAVVTHGDIMRVIPLTLYCDGMEVKFFRGDGIIASTPTGSTAYSLSAGGPIVDPKSDSILLTPLSAHALYAKSFVFSDQRTVDIQVGELENRSAYLSSDGFDAHRLHTGDIVRLSRSEHSVSLVKLKNEGFFSLLYRKL